MDPILVIVPCGQRKIWDTAPQVGPVPARDAYAGVPFKVNREFAERFATDWVILSAKYGFLPPEAIIPGPYNVTFKRLSTGPVPLTMLRQQVLEQGLGRFGRVIGLGGQDYRLMIENAFRDSPASVCFPFAGLPLGNAMHAIKEAIRRGRPFGNPVPEAEVAGEDGALSGVSSVVSAPAPSAPSPPAASLPMALGLSSATARWSPTAADFRRELESMLGEARQAGRHVIDVTARELHQRVGGYPGSTHRMPVCCAVMRKQMGPSDAVIHQPPSGTGATLQVRYHL